MDTFRRSLEVIKNDKDNSRITIKASVQLSNKKLDVPEKYKGADIYVLHADTELSNSDIVIIDNEKFEVIKVEGWQIILPHYKIYVVKI